MNLWGIFAGVAVVGALVGTNLWWWRRCRRQAEEFERSLAEARELEGRRLAEFNRDRAGFEAVLDCMFDGLAVVGGDDRIRLLNRAAARLFQVVGDARGRTLIEAVRRHELADFAGRARREGEALGLELELDGRAVAILQVNATTFADESKGGTGVILVFHDLTRLKELERTRREFVANVSHELRTPLALIKGFVETLIDGASADPEVAERFLRTIEKHANRLAFLIDDLLTISQLESGQSVMNFHRGAIGPVVERVLEDLEHRARERNTRLLNELPAGLSFRVDPDRLQQVLFNLVDNAIKYGRPGGAVRVGGHTDVALCRAELWVADDGPGIPRESLDRVFERFYRVDMARSRDQGGTGLGLSIVKHIVQAHGGEVRAESEPGKGAIFRLTFPWDPSHRESAPPETDAVPG
jgi:two-component system phosphate regulon sensor histidine kinase PhoR